MSNLERTPQEANCGGRAEVAEAPVRELVVGHEVALGGPRGMTVTRTLPSRGRRMVGAWCFADAYGPTDLSDRSGMRVPPHPHIGLQTVSWLVEGEVLHRDSLGNEQLVRPGQLNLMTAGNGISHSEQTPVRHTPWLHGVQLWVALPGADRRVEPRFEHFGELPVYRDGRVAVTVVMGELGDVMSPAGSYTPLVCADAALAAGGTARLPLRPDFEYAALVLSGRVRVDGVDRPNGVEHSVDGANGVELGPGPLLYLGLGRSTLAIDAAEPSRLLLLGGVPFEEQLVMWWNFVGRTHEDIVSARDDWTDGTRFGTVRGYDGAPLPAPALPTTPLKPRARTP